MGEVMPCPAAGQEVPQALSQGPAHTTQCIVGESGEAMLGVRRGGRWEGLRLMGLLLLLLLRAFDKLPPTPGS